MEINRIIDALELEEKIALVSGADQWHTTAIPRLNIPSIMVADGPHGLRKQSGGGDHLGIGVSEEATCFPPAATSANSWDPDLLFAMGKAIGQEALEQGVAVVLGPGVNIKRSPLCGRNFEYFSEDPYLTGELASAWIKGIQSVGVGASIKHFAGNNQERWRMLNDSLIDPRALREVYLAPFEKAVRDAKPWTVMAAYNQLNGVYCCEHPQLLTSILRKEWGFTGAVLSDWGAVNDPVLSIKAGLDLEMPASLGVSAQQIRADLSTGRLTEAQLNKAVRNVLQLIFKGQNQGGEDSVFDPEEHHQLARKIAAESAVLLQNTDDILPLNSLQTVAIIGEFAQVPRYQGSGSSQVNPTKVDTVLEQLKEQNIEYVFARGYNRDIDIINEGLIAEACHVAQEADVAVIFAGLTNQYESEGYDRQHLDLPPAHNELIRRVAEVNPNIVVVLSGGAPVIMPWLDQVKGVLHTYLWGQAGAGAVVDLLFGKKNPSGKLAESYPLKLEDHPASEFFAYDRSQTEYRESIFVGYRYYDVSEKEVLFPFGYGLSYTKFRYADLKLSSSSLLDTAPLTVESTITNVGKLGGAEIVQLYVGKLDSSLFRAPRELRGFKKVWLEPGESKQVEFTLDYRSFAYYNVFSEDWHVESGQYHISIGSSSRDLHLQATVEVESSLPEVKTPDYREKAPAYYHLAIPSTRLNKRDFEVIYGRKIQNPDTVKKPFHANSTLQDLQDTWIGRLVAKQLRRRLGEMIGVEDEQDPLWQMAWHMILEMPLRSVVSLSEGRIPHHGVQGLILWANRSYGQALKTWSGRQAI